MQVNVAAANARARYTRGMPEAGAAHTIPPARRSARAGRINRARTVAFRSKVDNSASVRFAPGELNAN
jgi:hypothetical protein